MRMEKVSYGLFKLISFYLLYYFLLDTLVCTLVFFIFRDASDIPRHLLKALDVLISPLMAYGVGWLVFERMRFRTSSSIIQKNGKNQLTMSKGRREREKHYIL